MGGTPFCGAPVLRLAGMRRSPSGKLPRNAACLQAEKRFGMTRALPTLIKIRGRIQTTRHASVLVYLGPPAQTPVLSPRRWCIPRNQHPPQPSRLRRRSRIRQRQRLRNQRQRAVQRTGQKANGKCVTCRWFACCYPLKPSQLPPPYGGEQRRKGASCPTR